MTLVVDASALVLAAVGKSDPAVALRARLVDEDCHAPHLIDAELGNVLRRQALRGEISVTTAAEVLRHAPRLIDHRYAQTGLLATAA
jgi:predicted nucleic acid-binding protein